MGLDYGMGLLVQYTLVILYALMAPLCQHTVQILPFFQAEGDAFTW